MNLTIEQMREIVAGAPEGQDTYCCDSGGYFKQLPIMKRCSHCLDLDTIRKSIDQHYYGRSEAEELEAYAELSQEKIDGGTLLVGDFGEAREAIDNALNAIAALCPKNIPEIEQLPIFDLKVGDECVLIWSREREIWKVKSLCIDGDVDIFHEPCNAHMCVPAGELRLVKLYRDSYTDHVSDIRNHIAPTTRVIEG